MTSPEAPRATSKPDWLVLGLFLLGGLAGAGLLGSGAVSLVYAAIELLEGREAAESFLSGAALLFAGALLLVAAGLALRRLLGYPDPAGLPARLGQRPHWLLAAFALVLWAGAAASVQPGLAWWLLPPLHLLAVSLPLLWLLWLALRRLAPMSPLRGWGAFSSGLALSPALSFMVELLAGISVALPALAYILASPDRRFNLERIITRLSYGDPSPEAIERILAPLVSDPVLIFFVLAYFALTVPLIEEVFKPAAVWLLLRRPLTERDGFALGALGGAGFALLENLTLGASVVEWPNLVVARLGTTAVHMLTAGLTGAAIVAAKSQNRYLRLLGVYLISVLIHGAWNLFALLPGLAEIAAGLPATWRSLPGVALLALGSGSTLALAALNRRYRTSPGPPAQS